MKGYYVFNVKVLGVSIGLTFSWEEACKWVNESTQPHNARIVTLLRRGV